MSLLSHPFESEPPAQKPDAAPAVKPLSTAQAHPPQDAARKRVAYDGQLLAQLRAEHRKLLWLLSDTDVAFVASDLARARAALSEFSHLVQTHLLTEQVRLYAYLEQAYAGDEPRRTLIHKKRQAASQAGQGVIRFLDKYNALDGNGKPALYGDFEADLRQVSIVLDDRIKLEESTLFPLYLPPDALPA